MVPDMIVLHLKDAEVTVRSAVLGELKAEVHFSSTKSSNCTTAGNRIKLARILEEAAKLLRDMKPNSMTVYGNVGEVLVNR